MTGTHIHIEMIGGLAGDMFLAAALDAGLVTVDELEGVFGELGLGRIEVHAETVKRYGIKSTHIEFSGWPEEEERDHRHLSEIEEMISTSALSDGVKARAIELFRFLGESEAQTHDIPIEKVHFHEIGAIDSILDFVGAAYVLATTDATWSAGKVPGGQGMVMMSHGLMPAIAPATARLLTDFVIEPRDVEGELVTPTGATILKALGVREPGLKSEGRLTGTGFGAGTKDFDSFANVTRLSVYDTGTTERFERDQVVRLETDLDDEHPEVLAHVESMLLDAGAIDVTRASLSMKKGRMGARLEVLCAVERSQEFAELLFRNTSTFGVRVVPVERLILRREVGVVSTSGGDVRIKRGYLGEELLKVTPEFEDCAAIAKRDGVPIAEVYKEVGAIIARDKA